MNVDAVIKLAKEIQNVSKEAKDKLELISINKGISEDDKAKIDKAKNIFSELEIAIEQKDINKMNKLLEDANKINI